MKLRRKVVIQNLNYLCFEVFLVPANENSLVTGDYTKAILHTWSSVNGFPAKKKNYTLILRWLFWRLKLIARVVVVKKNSKYINGFYCLKPTDSGIKKVIWWCNTEADYFACSRLKKCKIWRLGVGAWPLLSTDLCFCKTYFVELGSREYVVFIFFVHIASPVPDRLTVIRATTFKQVQCLVFVACVR